MSSSKFLLSFLYVSIIFVLTYIFTSHLPEIYINGFGLGIVYDVIFNLSIGYIISYIFYYMSMIKPLEFDIKRHSKTLVMKYMNLIKTMEKLEIDNGNFFTANNLNKHFESLPKSDYLKTEKYAKLIYNFIREVKSTIREVESINYENNLTKIIYEVKINNFFGLEEIVKVYSENDSIRDKENIAHFKIQEIYILDKKTSEEFKEDFEKLNIQIEKIKYILKFDI